MNGLMTPWLIESDYEADDNSGQINVRMGTMVRELGLDHFAFLVLRPPLNSHFDVTNTFRTSYPDAWINRYMALRYFEVDPVVTLARKNIRPFYWGQGRFLRGFKKPQRRVFDEARAYKINYGLSISVRGADGELSIFNVVSSDRRHLHDVTRCAHSRIFAAAFDTHDRVIHEMEANGFNPETDVELSIRERECLAWTLEGKTAGEIATILNLSVSTVNHHASSASHKLGTLNKHHAAVKALRTGLVQ